MMRFTIHGLHVDTNSLNKVKEMLKAGHKVVLMPIYKSFADMFIYLYVHHHFGLPIPFIIGNSEDAPSKSFERFLKAIGYVYCDR